MVVLNRKILALLQVVDYQAPAMASFNGSVPDPKTFMGGVGYNTPQ